MDKDHIEVQSDTKKWVFLIILILILTGIISFQYLGGQKSSEKVMICNQCNKKINITTANVQSLRCKCGALFGEARKCRSCDFEFGHIRKTINNIKDRAPGEMMQLRKNEYKCPNCGSIETFRLMPSKYIDALKKKKAGEEKKD